MALANYKIQRGMQHDVLSNIDVPIICAGGAAGTYKSETLLLDAVQEFEKPDFHGILFRTTFPELSRSLIPRAHALYSQMGATYDSQEHAFKWPWGSVMRFGYMGRDEDVYPHQSAQYTWIGFDESTHQTEFRVRYLLSRMRHPNPGLFKRMRLATNPGGPGHAFHMHTFLGGACPHCEHGMGRIAGKLYTDATWLSDKKSVGMDTMYIFGKWNPKGFLPDYDKQLDTLSGSLSKALKSGCWRSFEGQYFDIWEPKREGNPMVVARQTIKDDWWWTYWTGSDYGFSGSAAASVLFCTSPEDPRIFCLAEWPTDITEAHHIDIRSFGRGVYRQFLMKPARYEQPHRVVGNYLSPDAWNDRGDSRTLAHQASAEMEEQETERAKTITLADQANAELEESGLCFTKANNDRAGGAMLIYTMLQTGQLVIASTCKNVMAAIESRIHDKKEPEKVEKVIGDPLDDYFDAFRYGVYSYAQAEQKPLNLRIQERLQKAVETDPTRAFVDYQKIVREERDNEEDGDGEYYGMNASRRRRLMELEMQRRRRN